VTAAATGQAALTKRRLRWQCRRGMRELDLILLRFVEQHFDELDAGQRSTLDALLLCQDQLLLAWLMGRQQPSDGDQAILIAKIRAYHS